MITCEKLLHQPHIRHGFFTREGGVSGGIYASLNCGLSSGDTAENVRKNRSIVAESMGVEAGNLCIASQVHSAKILAVNAPWTDEPPEVDALVTTTPGIAIGVLTADCAPILLCDANHSVIGAVHAGWKGAFTGVIEAAIREMETLGARKPDIIATIGPCICQQSYEVDAAFYQRFLDQDMKNRVYFLPSSQAGHFLFDLPGYCKDRLASSGIKHNNILAHDTYSDENRFFSFRRATHKNESAYGRQLSVITLLHE